MNEVAQAAAPAAATRAEMEALLGEYVAVAQRPGAARERLDAWGAIRAAARRHWEDLLEAERFGRDVTAAAPWKLLPHTDGPLAQRHGAFVHPLAPAISRDLHAWFEGAGWVRADQWPDLGRGLFDLVRRCTDHPAELWPAIEAFLAVPGASAFTAEMISPVLHALRPTEFVLVDAASRTLLNHATGSAFSGSLRDYPAAHAALRRLLAELRPALLQSPLSDHCSEDVLEAFCHWVVHVRLLRRDEESPAKVAEVGPSVAEAEAAVHRDDALPTSEPTSPQPAPAGAVAALQEAPCDDDAPEFDDDALPAPATASDAPEPSPSEPEPDALFEALALAALEALASFVPVVRVAPALAAASSAPSSPAPSTSPLLERARTALAARGQLVLAGPPGAERHGLMRRLGEELAAEGDGLLEHVVFHPAWRYADFLRASEPDDPGLFPRLCRQAAERRGAAVLLVDEAEHADTAAVCGEAPALLEARGLTVTLAGGGRLAVPANVRVVFALDPSTRAGGRALRLLEPRCAVLHLPEPGAGAASA